VVLPVAEVGGRSMSAMVLVSTVILTSAKIRAGKNGHSRFVSEN